ncbi:MAG: ABC transporter permease subunit [Actinomycetota bacterium]
MVDVSIAVETTRASAPAAAAATAPEPTRGRQLGPAFVRAMPPLVVLVAAIGIWYLYSYSIGETERNISLPYFHEVVNVAFFTGENRTELLDATWVSAQVALIGLAISMALGIFFAVLMSQASWVERSFYPYAVLMQTVPILALVPLIGMRLGFGFNARVLVVVIISLFPIITNTLFGLKSAQSGLHDLFTLHHVGRVTRLRKLMFPASLPAMFTGFQISAGLSVIGAIVGGFFFGRGDQDLGLRIKLYSSRVLPEQLIGAVVMSALLGIIVFWFFGWAKNQLTASWDETTAG